MEALKEMLKGQPHLGIKYMIDALDNIPPNYQLNPAVFGVIKDGVCQACPATLTIAAMANHIFTEDELFTTVNRAKALNIPYGDLQTLEGVFNLVRIGDMDALGWWCEVEIPKPKQKVSPIWEAADWVVVRASFVNYYEQLLAEFGLPTTVAIPASMFKGPKIKKGHIQASAFNIVEDGDIMRKDVKVSEFIRNGDLFHNFDMECQNN